jgi:hypothetical protein
MMSVRRSLLAPAAVLLLVSACGGAQTHANTPESADPVSTDAPAAPSTTPDPAIQSSPAGDTHASAPSPAPAANDKPASDLESRIISGSALPPSIAGSNAAGAPTPKAAKPKKTGKGRKKS